MKKLLILFSIGLCVIKISISSLMATDSFTTNARSAVVIEISTGKLLFAKNPHAIIHPASLTKLMTLYIIFDNLKNNRLKLDTKVTVSENAYHKGGSKNGSSTMFLEPKTLVTVEDLIHGIATVSGNDASIVMAEAIAGSETTFAEYMNIYAKKLGLNNTHFTNSTGWPNVNHYSTAYDIVLLSKRLIEDFPEYYHFLSVPQFTYNKITQPNRNTLLFDDLLMVDGLKTGHTEKDGYNIAFSSTNIQGDRIVGMVHGLTSEHERAVESKKLITWVFFNLESNTLYKKGDYIFSIPVLYGKKSTLPVFANSDIKYFYNKNMESPYNYKAMLSYNSVLLPPIKKGDVIAKVNIINLESNNTIYTYALVSDSNVYKAGIFMRFIKTPMYIVKKMFTTS